MKDFLFAALLLVSGFGYAQVATPNNKPVKVTPVEAQGKTKDAKNEKAAEIRFDAISHDFGVISGNEPAKCTFTFTNTGTAPLIIHQAIATCGCTVPNYSKDPVKPGEKGQIEVTYNGRAGGMGHFMKGINVRSNAKTNPTVRLTIEGETTE